MTITVGPTTQEFMVTYDFYYDHHYNNVMLIKIRGTILNHMLIYTRDKNPFELN